MEKLQFEFTVTASTKDEKTNITIITSINTEEGKRYVLPAEFRHIGYHKELMKTENYSKLKNTLKTRHQKRKVWIKMTKELKNIYIDEDQNLQFENQYLEEIDEGKPEDTTQNDNLTKILEKLVEVSKKKEEGKNLKQISEKFMIEKFTSKHANAKQWMETFEKECTRFDVVEDETKIEILRLFLEKPCSDWHCATLTKLTAEAKWDEWKDRFLETFADKGWSTAKYALSFRYKEGSLTDYAIKKERLLLDMNKDIDSKTLTTLIAIGLPEFIMNKIDKEQCQDSTTLFNEVRKYENLIYKKPSFPKNEFGYKKKTEEKKPCRTCENLNKGMRYHPAEKCWFRTKEEEKHTNRTSLVGNNAVMDVKLNTEKKNE